MTGGCQCGAIRYEIASFPLLLYTCHCTDCQRQTGSAFGPPAPQPRLNTCNKGSVAMEPLEALGN
jgi:hypothetical protein